MSGVLVVMEQQAGAWHRMSWETLAAGQQLAEQVGQPLYSAVVGQGVAALAGEAATKKLDKVHAVEHALLKDYTADGFTAALAQLIQAHAPSYVLFPHTYQVRDFAPKLAARFAASLISDVVAFHAGPVFVRQLFQGKLNADIRPAGAGPVFVSVQAGAFRAESLVEGAARVETFAPRLDAAEIRTKPHEPFREAARAVDLGAAELIVSVGRGANLTRQLLAYAGTGPWSVEVLDLNAVVRDGIEILKVSATRTISLTVRLAGENLPIEGDATQIEQMLINLVMNAADAIEGPEGAIVVTTGQHVFDAADLAEPDLVIAPPATGDYATLTVSDTGPGMDVATRARIFEPFFTTKATGRGLGLAAVQGILRGHGGGVGLTTAPAQGTTFTVYLPITTKPIASRQEHAEPAPGLSTPRAAAPMRWTGSGTVLVVDDDTAVRDAAARNLRRLGFTTMSASNGRAALDVFQAHQDEITCVLLDRMMPKMDGVTAARELRSVAPELCIIMMTGYNEAEVVAAIEPGLVNSILYKPFSVEQLREELRKCLDPSSVTELT